MFYTTIQNYHSTEISPPNYAQVQALDPLQLDEFMKILPNLTEKQDLNSILQKLSEIVDNFDEVIYYHTPQSYASLRDIEFLIASCDFLETNSYKTIQRLEYLLERLGERTDHIPRGCTFTYILFNPLDERMRQFTVLTEERLFIEEVQRSFVHLDSSFMTIKELTLTRLDSKKFKCLTQELISQFEYMVKAMVKVKQYVPPEIFSLRLIPFYRPLDINGITYSGTTGAQAQILGIDLILYGIDIENESYRKYAKEYMAMLLPFHKQITKKIIDDIGGKSLLMHLHDIVHSDDALDINLAFDSLRTLQKYLRRLLAFRRPHFKVAVENLPLRKKEEGSGGHSLDMLELLIQYTSNAVTFVQKLSNEVAQRETYN